MESSFLARASAAEAAEFAALYRAACADLALAECWGWPPQVIDYLHLLVARAHNVFYRARAFQVARWMDILLDTTPRTIFCDPWVHAASLLFWIPFLVAVWLAGPASPNPEFAQEILGSETLDAMQRQFNDFSQGRSMDLNYIMAAYYIAHNAGIGLSCFSGGLLILPGVFILLYNAIHLGSVFGYMMRPEVTAGDAFYEFVTAHGPCELTAILLMAAAGLRLGSGWLVPGRRTRLASLRYHARKVLPVIGVALILFVIAALIEGFVSPSAVDYQVKALVAVVTSMSLMVYIVVLGLRRSREGAV
jgi:uncharacterized membrane protein SpoIIM required for sporulation